MLLCLTPRPLHRLQVHWFPIPLPSHQMSITGVLGYIGTCGQDVSSFSHWNEDKRNGNPCSSM
jgi:hypothetical protein